MRYHAFPPHLPLHTQYLTIEAQARLFLIIKDRSPAHADPAQNKEQSLGNDRVVR